MEMAKCGMNLDKASLDYGKGGSCLTCKLGDEDYALETCRECKEQCQPLDYNVNCEKCEWRKMQ